MLLDPGKGQVVKILCVLKDRELEMSRAPEKKIRKSFTFLEAGKLRQNTVLPESIFA